MRDERWRDDAWHEEAHDDPDDAPAASDAVDARFGVRDPRRNEWGLVDLGIGWGVAMLATAAVGLVYGVVGSLQTGADGAAMGAGIAVLAVAYGAPVVTVYGVPAAALAATVLRRVPWEWVHLVAFAGLGALGCSLLELAMSGVSGSVWVGPIATTTHFGVVAAVAGRCAAKRIAILRVDRSRIVADAGAA